MSRAHERANAAAWALLVSAAGAVLLVVLPSLGMIAPDPAGSAVLAVLALAFAMLVQSEIRCLLGCSRPMAAVAATRGQPTPMLPGRVTDPVHHPLRPRAPGLT